MQWHAWTVLGLLLVATVAGAAGATQPAQQTKASPAPAGKATTPTPTSKAAASQTSGPKPTQAQKQEIDDLNNIACERVRCSRADYAPVCAIGEGLAGCKPPEKGCTYTNGCMARCVYNARVAYMGECTHQGAMRIVEDGMQTLGQQPRPSSNTKAGR